MIDVGYYQDARGRFRDKTSGRFISRDAYLAATEQIAEPEVRTLREGDIVRARRGRLAVVRIVYDRWHYYHDRVYLYFFDGEYGYVPIRDIEFISESGCTNDLFNRFTELREELLQQIELLLTNRPNETLAMLQHHLTNTVSDHSWFWSTITTDHTDNRLLSWAEEPSFVLTPNRRRNGKFSKFLQFCIRKGFLDQIEDEQRNRLGYDWGELIIDRTQWDLEIVRGTAIIDLYDNSHGAWGSCFTGFDIQMLAQNPDKVGAVIFKHGGVAKGRALVWTSDDGVMLLDRPYPNISTIREAAKAHAQQHGWVLLGDVHVHYVSLLHPEKIPGCGRYFKYFDTFESYDTAEHAQRGEYEHGGFGDGYIPTDRPLYLRSKTRVDDNWYDYYGGTYWR